MTLLDLITAATPVLLVAGVMLIHGIYYLAIASVPTQMLLKDDVSLRIGASAEPVREAVVHESAA
jgi:hypothetical protein